MDSVAKLLDCDASTEASHDSKTSLEDDCDSQAGRVRFSFEDEIHEVSAYAEIYGLHPREFVFARDSSMIPAAGPWGFNSLAHEFREDVGDSDEEHEESDLEADAWTWVSVASDDAGAGSGANSSTEDDEDEEWASLFRDMDAERLNESASVSPLSLEPLCFAVC